MQGVADGESFNVSNERQNISAVMPEHKTARSRADNSLVMSNKQALDNSQRISALPNPKELIASKGDNESARELPFKIELPSQEDLTLNDRASQKTEENEFSIIRSRMEKEHEEVISEFKKFTQISHQAESEEEKEVENDDNSRLGDPVEDLGEHPNFAFVD